MCQVPGRVQRTNLKMIPAQPLLSWSLWSRGRVTAIETMRPWMGAQDNSVLTDPGRLPGGSDTYNETCRMSRNVANGEVQGERERHIPSKSPQTRGNQCKVGTFHVFICLVLTGQRVPKKEKQKIRLVGHGEGFGGHQKDKASCGCVLSRRADFILECCVVKMDLKSPEWTPRGWVGE